MNENIDINKIKSAFQLVNTSIVSLNVDNTFYDYNERDSGKRQIDVGFIVKETAIEEETKQHLGILDLKVHIVCHFDDDRHLDLNMILRGVFSAPVEMEEDQFNIMLEQNGCASLYSVARGTIASITSQMFTCGCIIVPMVNFIKFHELIEESEESTQE